MARNRKNQSGAIRFVPALKALLLCLFLGGVSVGYVMQKNKLYELGRQITEREARLDRLKYENRLRANQLADLQLPQRLAERVKEQRLGLVGPQPTQMVWLAEPTLLRPARQAEPMLAIRK
jgi:cell division protein FtsL